MKTKDRYEVIAAIAEARSHGDLSENAEYDAAKERQAFIEGRIAELESKLSSVQIIDPATLPKDDRVVFATTVRLEDLGSGQEVQYQIVGVDETDFSRNRISWVSPLARALLKAREGDQVRFQSPAGWREIEVVGIEYKCIDA